MIIDFELPENILKVKRIENLLNINPLKKKVNTDEITVSIAPVFDEQRMKWAVRKPNFIKERELWIAIKRDSHYRRLHGLTKERERCPKRLNFKMYL